MTLLDEYLQDLASVVNLDCGSYNPAGVTRVAEIMKGLYEGIGFTCELVDLGPKAGKGLIARNKPQADHYDVMMNGHLDTVFLDGTAEKRPLRIEGDRAMGPGCADCKAGVLSMYYACKNARPEDLERLSICCALNPDEEIGSVSSKAWLDEEAKKARRVLIFEPGRPGGELVRARKGGSTYRVTFHGQAAHAGNSPYDGANANLAAARFIAAFCGLADHKLGTTVNPGVIHGGSASNVISDQCEVVFDTRFWDDRHHEELHGQFLKLLDATWSHGVTQSLVIESHITAMPYNEATKDLVETMNESARAAGFEAEWIDAGGASDGNHIAAMGVPVVDGCGPAGGGFHSEKEYLRLETVEPRVRMIVEFLKRI